MMAKRLGTDGVTFIYKQDAIPSNEQKVSQQCPKDEVISIFTQ